VVRERAFILPAGEIGNRRKIMHSLKDVGRMASVCSLLLIAANVFGQNSPYVLADFAGSLPAGLGDGGAATAALFVSLRAAVPDSQGNVYILDSTSGYESNMAGPRSERRNTRFSATFQIPFEHTHPVSIAR